MCNALVSVIIGHDGKAGKASRAAQGELDELEREEFFRLKKVQANKKKVADELTKRVGPIGPPSAHLWHAISLPLQVAVSYAHVGAADCMKATLSCATLRVLLHY